MYNKLLQLLPLLLTPMLLLSQVDLVEKERFAFEPDLSYDGNITSPAAFLAYELGEQFTVYEKVVQYFKLLDEQSGKMTLHQYGATYEGRKLYNVVITSESNHQNLENIRADHLQLCDPRNIDPEAASDLIANLPIFTSMSYNIHGNEASGTEAVMQVAYRLVAATDNETQQLLDNSVIILYICINPDGRDRYVYWYNGVTRNKVGLEPRDLEHYEPWPGGRTNHYWFDLNRDWVWRVHPESQGHTTTYQYWLPNLHVDYHEQGYHNNYFTVPGTTPKNLLLPDRHHELSDTIGRANIASFDKHNISYFTREAFDFFYPGYGSSYPASFGAISMLTEQGGIGAGRAVETEDGHVLKLRQRIFDHYSTSIATMKKAAEQRVLFRNYSFESLNPENTKSDNKGYVFPYQEDPYLNEVINILLAHGIEVHQAKNSFTLASVAEYQTGKVARKQFKKGDYIINTNQPKHLFINSILQRTLEIEDSVMYDMSTWAAPIAYNLEAYEVKSSLASVEMEVVEALPELMGSIDNPTAKYCYVIPWEQRYAPKALALLWEKGYKVRSAVEPFSFQNRTFKQGALIVLIGRNLEKKEEMVKDMATVAAEAKVKIFGLNTGRMDDGYDIGSSKNRPVKQPKVALMVDAPFSSYTAGQIYYLFDWETGLPIQRVRTSVLEQTAMPPFRQRYGRADLKDYDVLILAGGGSGLKHLFKKEQLAEIKDWVMEGGVLIATESAATFFTEKGSKFTKLKMVEASKDSSETAKYLPFDQKTDYNGKKRIPGAALNAIIDITNPLAFGMKEDLFALKFGVEGIKPDPDFETVGYYHKDVENLLAAGYASEENLKVLAGNAFAGVKRMGEGKVVFFVDNTQYRMFWRGPSRMMQNAVMLLPGF